VAALFEALEARRRAGVKDGKGGKAGGASGRGLRGGAEDEADPYLVSMNANPITALAQRQSSAAIMTAEDVAAQSAPPDACTWRIMRDTFAATDTRAKVLAVEVAQLREQLASGGGAGASGDGASPVAPSLKAGKRNTFAPSTASGGDAANLLGGGAGAKAALKARVASRRGLSAAAAEAVR
jgi:hypothetical protein